MSRCMEIEWKGSGVFVHKGAVQDWKLVVESPRVAAVRKLEDIEFGEWTTVYEVDRVISETGRRETARRRLGQEGEASVPTPAPPA